ncbi:10327_t:CDS:2, partial [Ambispora gerdemannii]
MTLDDYSTAYNTPFQFKSSAKNLSLPICEIAIHGRDKQPLPIASQIPYAMTLETEVSIFIRLIKEE